MIQSFRDRGTEDIFDGSDSAVARKSNLQDLRVPPGNRLERLEGNRKGQLSIRINEQYRICFRWENSDAYDIEITDYH